MKRICIVCILALVLTGCKAVQEIRPDTIVDIPLNPTRPAAETAPEESEPAAQTPTRLPAPEVPTIPETVPEETAAPTMPQRHDTGGLDRAVAEAVNAARQANGLPPLTPDARLDVIASLRAAEAAEFWGGVRPDGSAGTTALDEFGYSYTIAAETLYAGIGGAEAAVSQWMGLSHTRQRLLMDADAIGVGVCTVPDGRVFVAVLIVG